MNISDSNCIWFFDRHELHIRECTFHFSPAKPSYSIRLIVFVGDRCFRRRSSPRILLLRLRAGDAGFKAIPINLLSRAKLGVQDLSEQNTIGSR
jgi:hypothetical protein